jgi:two-component system sensor histidine kinase KdpD
MGGALAALWLSPLESLAFSGISVALFNFFFINPRLSFAALLHDDLLLLVTLLGVSTGISYLLSHLRRHADEREQAILSERRARDDAQDKALRNTLLTAISHDYRTPLATITGAASSLASHASTLPAERVVQLADAILDEAGHLNRMTSNTLQLARLDAERVSIHKEWESIEEIIGNVVLRARRNHVGREIHADTLRPLPLLQCDATLIVQLLDNLVDNAVAYSTQSAPVYVRARHVGDELWVQVIDQGPGIPDAWKHRVFDVFQRADAGVSADAASGDMPRRGVGVGLAVCRAIARVHNAQLFVTDASPAGSVFHLILPVQAQPAMPMQFAEEAV